MENKNLHTFLSYGVLNSDEIHRFIAFRLDHFVIISKRILGRRFGLDPLTEGLRFIPFPTLVVFSDSDHLKLNVYVEFLLKMIASRNNRHHGMKKLSVAAQDIFFREGLRATGFLEHFLWSLHEEKKANKELKRNYFGPGKLSEKELRAVAALYLVDLIYHRIKSDFDGKVRKGMCVEELAVCYANLAYGLNRILIDSEIHFDQMRKALIGAQIFDPQKTIIAEIVKENPTGKPKILRTLIENSLRDQGLTVPTETSLNRIIRGLRKK
jgi:hypothetical protein